MRSRITRSGIALLYLFTSALAHPQELGPSQTVTSDFFGMHIHRAANGTAWPGVDFGSWRLWDSYVSWRDLEPSKGQWRFDLLDRLVSMAELRGIAVMLTLGSTPAWASARPAELCSYGRGCAAEPVQLEDWENYVRTVASRYRGRIEAYELWNEVHCTELDDPYDASGKAYFYSGSCAKMIELGRSAYRIIKDIDANAKVASPSMHVYGDWVKRLRLYLEMGGAAYTDLVSFHFYASSPEDALRTISAVHTVMKESGVGDTPVWNTESGFAIRNELYPETATAASAHDAAGLVARSLVLNAAAGISRFYWYAWDDGIYGLTASGGQQPNEAALAYAAAQRWLTGATIKGCRRHSGKLWSCQLEKEAHRYWVVWCAECNVDWQPPGDWRVSAYQPLLAKDAQRIPERSLPIPLGGTPVLLLSE